MAHYGWYYFWNCNINRHYYKIKNTKTRFYLVDYEQRRNDLQISQEELAHTIGVTKTLVSKWERYYRTPSMFMFNCWVESLGLQIKIHEKETE